MRTDASRRATGPGFLMAIGAVCTVIALAGTIFAANVALRAWLAAAFLWSGVPIGALGLLMMMRLIPGVWDDELMLPTEAASMLMPLAALAFVPVLIGLGALYGWVGQEQETAFRRAYLAEGFFVLRTVLSFAALLVLTYLLIAKRRWSVAVSCLGLVIYTLVGSVLAVDWLMSLDPEFHSSGFGLYILSIQMTVALAWVIASTVLAGSRIRRPEPLGALLLTTLLFWAYFSFMQYFIIWSGDLPAPVAWYQRRATDGWSLVLWVIAALHAVPTFFLLFPAPRKSRRALLASAAAIILGKALEAAWLVLPAESAGSAAGATLFLVVATIGLGSLFAAAYARAFRMRLDARAPHSTDREALP